MEVEQQYINNRLRYHRTLMKYKLKDVAFILKLDRPDEVGLWENGQMFPNGRNLIKLCLIYRTFPQELYPEFFLELKKELLQREQALFHHLS